MAIWADATFVWNPGGSSTASFDELTMTDAAGITEGSFVSSPRDGRTYSGAVASRFDGLVAAAAPQTTGMTLMAAIRCPSGGERILGLTVADKDDADQWARLDFTNTTTLRGDYRNAGSAEGAANWPSALFNGAFDTGIHIVVVRFTPDGAGKLLIDTFLDNALYASDYETITGTIDMDRLTVGRLEDSSPSNSSGGQVFAAASWDRPLTDAEIRAISSNPYSYPTDPSDPDDWEEGAADTEWEDAAFYYDPNHVGSRGLNSLYGTPFSDAGLNEGAEVTVATVDGRQYNGAQGSRFDIIPINMASRFADVGDVSATWMAVVARPGATSAGGAIWLGDARYQDCYFLLEWDDTAEKWQTVARLNTGTPGANYLIANVAGTDADTSLHVLVARYALTGGTGVLDLFVDSILSTDSDTQTVAALSGRPINRITVGRTDDGNPTNGVNLQVFAAAFWERALTDDEITAVLADPYGFPGSAPTPPTPAVTGTGRIRGARYGLTRLARR